MAKYV